RNARRDARLGGLFSRDELRECLGHWISFMVRRQPGFSWHDVSRPIGRIYFLPLTLLRTDRTPAWFKPNASSRPGCWRTRLRYLGYPNRTALPPKTAAEIGRAHV